MIDRPRGWRDHEALVACCPTPVWVATGSADPISRAEGF